MNALIRMTRDISQIEIIMTHTAYDLNVGRTKWVL